MGRTLHDLLRSHADLWAAAVQVVLLAVVLVPGRVPWAGPEVLGLTQTHGVHVADLLVVLLGLLVLATATQRGVVGELARSAVPAGRLPSPATLSAP